jgi:hypothetical protein
VNQALNFGSGVASFLQATVPKKSIVLVRTSTVSELGATLASVWNRFGRFRSVLVIGHSNAKGLQLTNDHFFEWNAVGQWLKKFEPRSLFLAACDAGGSEAVRRLFASIPSLRDVYASPIKLYSGQTAPLAVLILSSVQQRRIDNKARRVLQGVNYVLTGGQLYRWKRSETGTGRELEGCLYDLAASLLAAASKNFERIGINR